MLILLCGIVAEMQRDQAGHGLLHHQQAAVLACHQGMAAVEHQTYAGGIHPRGQLQQLCDLRPQQPGVRRNILQRDNCRRAGGPGQYPLEEIHHPCLGRFTQTSGSRSGACLSRCLFQQRCAPRLRSCFFSALGRPFARMQHHIAAAQHFCCTQRVQQQRFCLSTLLPVRCCRIAAGDRRMDAPPDAKVLAFAGQ
ncbi:hypothetical protein D3C85_1290530 [compost metagenome]